MSEASFHGLFVGIDRYSDPLIPDLRCATSDAQALGRLFTNYASDAADERNVRLLLDTDATERRIKSGLLVDLPQRAAPNDIVVFFFAGHGAALPSPKSQAVDGIEKYLLACDSEAGGIPASAIPMQVLAEAARRITARRLVFILDCCHSGSASVGRSVATPGLRMRTKMSDEYLSNLAGEGRMVLAACAPEETAIELTDQGHGLFTFHLLRGLEGAADRDSRGMVTVDHLYEYLCDHVTADARKRGFSMRPVRKGDAQGHVTLTRYRTQRQEAALRLLAEARAHIENGELSDAVRLLYQALVEDPENRSAQDELEQLAQQQAHKKELERSIAAARNERFQMHRDFLRRLGDAGQIGSTLLRHALSVVGTDGSALSIEEAEFREMVTMVAENRIRVATFLRIYETSDLTIDRTESLPGDFANYRLGDCLKTSDSYSVHLATEEGTAREVVVKSAPHPGPAATRLLREAQLLAKLAHPNIVGLLNVQHSVDGSRIGMVLAKAGKRRAPRIEDLRWILAGVLRALAYAHRCGVVHRSIRQEHILGHEYLDQATLIGWGNHWSIENEEEATWRPEAAAERYSAPELFQTKHFDGRSDLYSLGVAALELSGAQWRDNQLFIDADLWSRVPPRVRFIVDGMIKPDVTQRWPSAARALILLSTEERIPGEAAWHAEQKRLLRAGSPEPWWRFWKSTNEQ